MWEEGRVETEEGGGVAKMEGRKGAAAGGEEEALPVCGLTNNEGSSKVIYDKATITEGVVRAAVITHQNCSDCNPLTLLLTSSLSAKMASSRSSPWSSITVKHSSIRLFTQKLSN